MTASTLCVAHCIATPFVAAALPIIAAAEGATHGVLALAVLSFGLLAIVPGFREHRRRQVLGLGFAGAALIWLPVLLPESLSSESLETAATVSGGIAMVTAHLFNLYFCRTCRVCAESPR
jgi:hypothetical protein